MTDAAERGLPYPMQHKIGESAHPCPPTRTAERHDWHLQSADPLSPWLEVVSADPHACSALVIVPAPTGLLAFRAWEGLWVCFGGFQSTGVECGTRRDAHSWTKHEPHGRIQGQDHSRFSIMAGLYGFEYANGCCSR